MQEKRDYSQEQSLYHVSFKSETWIYTHTKPPEKLKAPEFVRFRNIASVANGSKPPRILRAEAFT